LTNAIRNKRLSKFKALLHGKNSKEFLDQWEGASKTKPVFARVLDAIDELFFVWDYEDAIKFYDEWLTFLIESKNNRVLKELDFLTFAEGHHMSGKTYDNVRQKYIDLFKKYLDAKKQIGALESVGAKKSLFFRTGINANEAKILMKEYNTVAPVALRITLKAVKAALTATAQTKKY